MPRTRSVVWSELKLGVVGVAALAMATTLILAVGGQGGFFWQRYPLKVQFDNAQGLKTGAVVRLSGKDVGKVTAVDFVGAHIEVQMQIAREVRPLITTDSRATIGSLSLLGEAVVDLTAAPSGTPLGDWAYVPAGRGGGPLGGLTASASEGLDQASRLIADIRAGRGTLGKLITDDALYHELQQFVASAEDVTRQINQGQGTLGALIRDPAAYDALKTSLENLRTMTARINSGQGALGRLLNDDAVGQSVASATANAAAITGRLNRGEGTAGKLLTDQQLWDRLNSVTNRVDALVANLEAGQGTAGQLLHDQRLYENMNQATTELRDLLADIRKDPKKYLRVSVSIF
jgi:phospholipid/cholesterol/gamma-HCH transport system substrate-binding protein